MGEEDEELKEQKERGELWRSAFSQRSKEKMFFSGKTMEKHGFTWENPCFPAYLSRVFL